MPVGMHYHYTEGLFDLAIIFQWLSPPQWVVLYSAFGGSKLRTRGSIHPQYSAWLQKMLNQRKDYDSYQIVFGTTDKLYVYSNSADRICTLEPGLYSFSNTDDELSRHKLNRSCEILEEYLSTHSEPDLDDLIDLFSDTKQDKELTIHPKAISLDTAKRHSSIFIEGQDFGTVNTTAILVSDFGCQGQLKIVAFRQDKNVGFWQLYL